MIIYKTTNLINGKIYIGRDKNDNDSYLGSGLLLSKAIKKYGKENFKKETIEKCSTIKNLNEREIFWIYKLNSRNKKIGYNIAVGGECGTHTKSWCKRQQIMMKNKNPFKNKHHDDATKKFLSEQRIKWWKTKGKLLTSDEKSKLYGHQKNKGKPCSESRRMNISKKRTRYLFSLSTKDGSCITFIWRDLKERARQLGLSYSYLKSMFTTRYKEGITYKGWILNKEIINGHNI